MKKTKLIPFWLKPASWGLKGISRTKAEIEYYYEGKEKDILLAETEYTGEELMKKKIDIQHKYGELDVFNYRSKLIDLIPGETDRKKARLQLDLDFEKISQYDYDIEMTKFETDKTTRAIQECTVDLKHGKINEIEYEKKVATALGEPWVKVLSVEFDPSEPSKGSFELDWNSVFVEKLQASGYAAPTAEQTVDIWFDELCKNIALSAYDGVGDFNEKLDQVSNAKPTRKKKK